MATDGGDSDGGSSSDMASIMMVAVHSAPLSLPPFPPAPSLNLDALLPRELLRVDAEILEGKEETKKNESRQGRKDGIMLREGIL